MTLTPSGAASFRRWDVAFYGLGEGHAAIALIRARLLLAIVESLAQPRLAAIFERLAAQHYPRVTAFRTRGQIETWLRHKTQTTKLSSYGRLPHPTRWRSKKKDCDPISY